MKKGYVVLHTIGAVFNFIIVSNYKNINRIHNYGFYAYSDMLCLKDCFDIGVWKIKQKKYENI